MVFAQEVLRVFSMTLKPASHQSCTSSAGF